MSRDQLDLSIYEASWSKKVHLRKVDSECKYLKIKINNKIHPLDFICGYLFYFFIVAEQAEFVNHLYGQFTQLTTMVDMTLDNIRNTLTVKILKFRTPENLL